MGRRVRDVVVHAARCGRCGGKVGLVQVQGDKWVVVDDDLGLHKWTCQGTNGDGRQLRGWPILGPRSVVELV